ncbi:MAG: SDR family oxidoreductase [Planctomycetota bacterium]
MSAHNARNYLILGATGGIGSSLAKRLADAGAALAIAGRDESKVGQLASEVGAAHHEAFDATDHDGVVAFVDAFAKSAGRIDGVVNCIGSLLLKPAHATSSDEFRQTVTTNLFTAFSLVHGSAKHMMKQDEGGSVVLLSSAVYRHGYAAHEAIAASKAGIVGLSLSAAASYASRGVRFNCVAPGLTETPLTQRVTSNDATRKASLDMHADGSFGTPAQVASAIAWLLEPEQSHVTGQVIAVDGGLGSVRSK